MALFVLRLRYGVEAPRYGAPIGINMWSYISHQLWPALFLASKNPCQLPQRVSDPAKWRVRLPSVCPSLSSQGMARPGPVCACRRVFSFSSKAATHSPPPPARRLCDFPVLSRYALLGGASTKLLWILGQSSLERFRPRQLAEILFRKSLLRRDTVSLAAAPSSTGCGSSQIHGSQLSSPRAAFAR
jgi:hypothetical protein